MMIVGVKITTSFNIKQITANSDQKTNEQISKVNNIRGTIGAEGNGTINKNVL